MPKTKKTSVPPQTEPDVSVLNDGSVVLFTPNTDAARDWVRDNVQLEDWQWLGNGFAVDHRYAGDLAEGMVADGLVLTS